MGKKCEIAVFSLNTGFGHFSALPVATGMGKNIPMVKSNSVLGYFWVQPCTEVIGEKRSVK